ncbi:MAG: DUF1365 domain-containing protein [Pseudomonadota bacterium]|nr:DUF1365 domain-containing protein [Pseudomonadota bacterium]
MKTVDLALAHSDIRHKRYHPKTHEFQYQIGYILVDVDAIESLCSRARFWSFNRFNFCSLNTRHYLPSTLNRPELTIRESVEQLIAETHADHSSFTDIKLLTVPRFLWFNFNPVSFYFVYCQASDQPSYIIADITNTPWGERHAYCLRCQPAGDGKQHFAFHKAFHVSPFMPMNLDYHWRFEVQRAPYRIHMALKRTENGEEHLDFVAHMRFKLSAMSAKQQRRYPFSFPWQSLKVVWGIYWQAYKLWRKRIPFFTHPKHQK